VTGSADAVGSGTGAAFAAGNDGNYYILRPNPVDFADIRGQSRFALGDKATLTVDPYFFYTLANGGGTTALSEKDPRLAGSRTFSSCAGGGTGADLNGDGDCLDSVLVYSPSNTQTFRSGVNASLIYALTDNQKLQVAYSYDYGRHRQTGEYTTINQQTGDPANLFGARPGYGPAITALDGSILRKRDRFSIAELNQVSAAYIGKFMDNRLHVSVGVRAPYFTRKLHDFCYDYNGANYVCDTFAASAVATALATDNSAASRPVGGKAAALSSLLGVTVKYGPNGLANFRLPFQQTYHYDKVLPNAGLSYDINDHEQVYLTFAEGFAAPKTDNLYTSTVQTVQPETSYNYGAGWRYNLPTFNISANLWATEWKNHIVTAFDPNDPTVSIDRNVGAVSLYGLDVEAGWRVTEALTLYASAALAHSELDDNYAVQATGGPRSGQSVYLPVKGKQLVMTPDQTYSLRAQYKLGDFTFGTEGKYTGKRFATDMNDYALASKLIVDADVEWDLKALTGHAITAQLNVKNLFNEKYLVRANTSSNNAVVTLADGTTIASSAPSLYVGAPVLAYVGLKARF
jgi:iron complex outermembrane receptor protein